MSKPATYDAVGNSGLAGSAPVFRMPIAVIVARGFQIFLAFLIIVLSGLLMHGLVLGEYTFSLVCGFFTLGITLYAILSEKVLSCRKGYNYWAVFSMDLLMIIFWLASMGAVAALRASFKYASDDVCYDDGSTFNAGKCYRKRYAVSTALGRAEMSAVAGLSALEMLLFVASFAVLAHNVRLHHQARKSGGDGSTLETGVQAQPMLNLQGTPTPAPAAGPGYTAPAAFPYQQTPYETAYTGAPAATKPESTAYAYPVQSQTPVQQTYAPNVPELHPDQVPQQQQQQPPSYGYPQQTGQPQQQYYQ